MHYDFDKIIERRGSGCYKYDCLDDKDVMPLWIADMDFQAAPAIQAAIKKRAEHGIFGYTKVGDEYYDAVINWFKRRHGWTIDREWIQYTTGVVPAISCVIKAISMPGDKILLTTPVYNCFFSCISNNGCLTEESPLIYGDDGKYHFDWEDFENRCSDDKVIAYLLCNPHNPGGRVWLKEELEKICDICNRHNVLVISDEIHNELVMPGYKYTPFASISEKALSYSITCTSASKSFNIAGLQMANIICSDAALRRRIDRAININEVCDVNPFGLVAQIAAYNESEDWIDQLDEYIFGNYQLLIQRIKEEGYGLMHSMPLEGTYLAWVDCKDLCKKLGVNCQQLEEMLISEAKIFLNAGTMYGAAGEGFLRINMACPRAVLNEALNRFFGFLKKVLVES